MTDQELDLLRNYQPPSPSININDTETKSILNFDLLHPNQLCLGYPQLGDKLRPNNGARTLIFGFDHVHAYTDASDREMLKRQTPRPSRHRYIKEYVLTVHIYYDGQQFIIYRYEPLGLKKSVEKTYALKQEHLPRRKTYAEASDFSFGLLCQQKGFKIRYISYGLGEDSKDRFKETGFFGKLIAQ